MFYNFFNRYVFIFLIAIIFANVTVSLAGPYGPAVSVVNAFLFIGLDLTGRDNLHEIWSKNRFLKMLILILIGGFISWVINRDSAKIALASCISFMVAAGLDTIVYSLLYRFEWLVKSNGSNFVSGLSDSIIFPTLAFGGFNPLITALQFGAKITGGLFWSYIIGRISKRSLVWTQK